MTISDPSQILQRIPELHDLTGDSKIRHAIESGDPFKIYRSLVLAKLLRRLPQHKTLLQMLTSQRRLFARGLNGTPSLGTFNSVGFSFVGKSEQDSEDYYIALHAFVILFAIPIVPLGSYLVQSTGNNQWQIFARVPLGIWGWLYTRGLASAMVLLVLLGAGTALHQSSTQDLTILNGFSDTLIINHDGQSTPIPAQGKTVLNLKTGPQNLVASIAKAGQVDIYRETLQSKSSTIIWNVAGAAPLLMNHVVYYPTGTKPEDIPPSKQEVYCGKSLVEFTKVDYLFVEPPSSRTMNIKQPSLTEIHLTIAQEPKLSGADICLNWGLGTGEAKSVATVARTVAAMRNWNPDETGVAVMAALEQSPAAAIEVISSARKARPKEVDFERGYRNLMEITGQIDALRTEYTRRVQQQPNDPLANYLLASIRRGQDGIAALQEAQQRFPDYAPTLASLAWRKVAHHDYAGAANDFKRLHALSKEEASSYNDTELDALLGQKKAMEAKNLLEKILSDKNAENQYHLATRLALITRQTGGKSEDVLNLSHFARAQWLDLARLQAGLPELKAETRQTTVAELILALRDNPGKAIELAMKKNAQLDYLTSEYRSFLLVLAMRQHHAALIGRLQFQLHLSKADRTLLQTYIDGGNADLGQGDLSPELQTAAHFFRSRHQQLPGDEREKLRKLAFQSDLQPNLVRHALNNWPQ